MGKNYIYIEREATEVRGKPGEGEREVIEAKRRDFPGTRSP